MPGRGVTSIDSEKRLPGDTTPSLAAACTVTCAVRTVWAGPFPIPRPSRVRILATVLRS